MLTHLGPRHAIAARRGDGCIPNYSICWSVARPPRALHQES
jgi:hypothetical protein